jgi:hypothetical protein
MSIELSGHRAEDAIRFKLHNGNNTFLIIGGVSPWVDENDPPDPTPENGVISDPVCAQKAVVKWVKEDPTGTIMFTDANGVLRKFLEITTEADMRAANSFQVMIEATILGNNIGVAAFRKVGFASGVVPAVGYENASFLSSGHVSSWGHLEIVEYTAPETVQAGASYLYRNIIQY